MEAGLNRWDSPNNLQDVADSCLFLWDVQPIRSGAGHKILLPAEVRHKLEKKIKQGIRCIVSFHWIFVSIFFCIHDICCTSIESSVLSGDCFRLMMLAVLSNASLSSFRKTPQNGTTYEKLKVRDYKLILGIFASDPPKQKPHLNKIKLTLQPGMLSARVTIFLYSEEDSC